MRGLLRKSKALASILICLALAGCALGQRLPAVPLAEATSVDILGIPDARFYVVNETPRLEAYTHKMIARRARYVSPDHVGTLLAISGGADDGAFGAGVLTGWSASGTRPKFDVVTGISTGALSAPFAFLGPEYDDKLSALYTSVTASDIYTTRPIFYAALFSDGLADTAPLHELISRHLDQQMMGRIAAEFRKGRLLLIGTTNLDQSQPVIWNMGAIANSGHPGAHKLMVDILTASASVPGIFSPVMLDVTVNGIPYQEMHVDGGTVAQSFLYPPTLSLKHVDASDGVVRKRVAYVIRNGRLTPPETTVEQRTLSIAAKTFSTMIANSGVGDTYRMYLSTKRDGVDFNFAHIDDDFKVPYSGPFDPVYMRKLYQYGFAKARRGYPWMKEPPYFAN